MSPSKPPRETPRRSRRRPGRVRRWVVRPFFWGLAAVVLAFVALLLVLESRWAREHAARLLVEQLEPRLGVAVRVESVDFDLVPLEARVHGLVLGGGDGLPPFAEVPMLVVEADVGTFLQPSLHLGRVHLSRPRVRPVFTADGSDNLPRWRRRGDGSRVPAPVAVSIGWVEIEGGLVEVDERRLPLELAARGVEARLQGGGEALLEGRVTAAEVSGRLRDGRPELGRVAVDLRLERDRLVIPAGSARGPEHEIDFHGRIEWRDDREVALEIAARTDGSVLGRWGLVPFPLTGVVEFDGGLGWRPQSWGLRGDLASPRLELLERDLADVAAVLSLDRNGLLIDLERAVYGGGRLAGAIELDLTAEERPLEIDLRLAEVSLARLLDDQGIPLTGVAGRVSGPFFYRTPASRPRDGDGWADLRIERPVGPGAAPGALALAGSVALGIGDGVIRTEAARLRGDEQSLVGRGAFDLESGRGRFALEIESRDVAALLNRLPAAAAALESGAAWAPRTGSGRIEVDLALDGGEVTTDLVIDLDAVDAPGYTADRLFGSLRISSWGVERMRLELQRQEAVLLAIGHVPLGEGGELSVAVDLGGWPIEDLAPWLPFAMPLVGPVSGELELGGSPAELVGAARARVEPAELAGVALPAVEAALILGFEEIQLIEAAVELEGGAVRLTGSIERASGELDLTLESDPLAFDRAPLDAWVKPALAGTLAVAGELSGTATAPRAELVLTGQSLAFAGRPLGRDGVAVADVAWDGERLEAAGSLAGLLRFAGGGAAAAEGLDLELEIESDELHALVAAFSPAPPPAFEGSFAGRLAVSGPASAPRFRVELERLTARREDLTLANLEPVVAELADGELVIASLYLGQASTESELFVGGRVELESDGALDLQLQGALAPAWLEGLIPGVHLDGGAVEALGSVGGTLEAPQIDGIGRLAEMGLRIDALPTAFEQLDAVILFYPDRVVLDSARARAAGGSVRAGGTLRPAPDWSSPDYRLQLSGESLSLRYPEGWRLRGDVELTLVSLPGDAPTAGRQLSGVVRLDRAFYLEPVDLGVGSLMQSLFERRRIEVEETDEELAATALNLQVLAPDALRVRNNVAELQGSAELTVRGSLARPVVFGRVELDPEGTFTYAGTEYTVERGLVTFVNPYRIEPVIDLVATTDLRDYDLTLTLTGTPERLNASVASDPPLADLEVLSLLTGGSLGAPGATDEATASSFSAEQFLYGQATSFLTERVNRLFGLDKLRVDPLTGASGDVSSARVTLGKQLSRDLFATFSYDPSTTEEQILQLDWRVSPTLSIVATQNGDGSYALDARWEKTF